MPTSSVASECEVRLSEGQAVVRPTIRGKFIFEGSQKFFIKGVTYGSFRANDVGIELHDRRKVRQDFATMASHGINTVRIQHATPPLHILDIAAEYDLRVMAGMSAEQYVGYLLDGKKPVRAFSDVRSKVRSVERHPALLCYALGNEIPAATARWLGGKRIERYLHDLYKAVKDEDPEGLVTYANYPSTEYLHLQFLDFCCFNVYLEKQHEFDSYLARLQNIALDRPLVVSELGLCSRRNGLATQANVLDRQIRSTFEAGCAGAVVFSWTDEWFSGGSVVTDWDFGLTDRHRQPKPALFSVCRAFEECPFPPQKNEPLISVVVCSYNGSATIGECLDHLSKLNYSNYEVIVVDDGSTDNTAEIAQGYDVRLIRTKNFGLSAARNTGREFAQGVIVAYIDDDAYPDVDWLNYYSRAFQRTSHALIGGPNLVPLNDPPLAQCVARAPGSPTHVLLTDTHAEHVPGCNMVFRKSCLEEIGGFDPTFRTAGDDVDICWRIQEKGWTIGFAPAAMVWHHRRASILKYWRQQRGYGRAEALLHQKWPSRFNISNHLPWAGRIYHAGVDLLRGSRSVIYHGVWGGAPFQDLHCSPARLWEHLLEIPELYLLNATLALLSALGLLWRPMLIFVPLLCIGSGYPLFQAGLKARHARFSTSNTLDRWRMRIVTALLHVVQPLARLRGRLQYGLTPWKRRGRTGVVVPYRRTRTRWTDKWMDPHERLHKFEKTIAGMGLTVWRGNAYEPWDLDVFGGLLGSTRVLMAVEEHGSGNQYVRLSAWPRFSKLALMLAIAGVMVAVSAALSRQFLVTALIGSAAALLLGGIGLDAGRSLAAVLEASDREEQAELSVRRENTMGVFNPVPARVSVERLHHASARRNGSDGLVVFSAEATACKTADPDVATNRYQA
jgi:GT2 family glycosyltransferase